MKVFANFGLRAGRPAVEDPTRLLRNLGFFDDPGLQATAAEATAALGRLEQAVATRIKPSSV